MADYFAGLGHSLDVLLAHPAIYGFHGLQAGVYVLGAIIAVGFCAAVPSAFRIAFLRCSAGR